jgi:hypothetical protein
MHWQEWFLVLSALAGILFTIRTMRLPLRRPDRWIYRREWLIVLILLMLIFVTISLDITR